MSSADWCGPSRQVYPHLNKLAYALKDSSAIAIAKIDTDDNEMDSNVWPETSIPTMKLFVKGKQRTPIVYDGERTYEGMVRFIEKETGCSLASLLAGQYPLYVAKRNVLGHLSALVAAVRTVRFPDPSTSTSIPQPRQFVGLHFTDPGRLVAEQAAAAQLKEHEPGTPSITLPGAGNAAVRDQLHDLMGEVGATDEAGNAYRYTGKVHNLAPAFEGMNGTRVLRRDDDGYWCLRSTGDDGKLHDMARNTETQGESVPPDGPGWVRLTVKTDFKDRLSPSFGLTVAAPFKRALRPDDKVGSARAGGGKQGPAQQPFVRVGFFAAPDPTLQVLLVAVDTDGRGESGRSGVSRSPHFCFFLLRACLCTL